MSLDSATHFPEAVARDHRSAPRSSISPKRAARVAGLSYLVMFVLAIFANFYVREGLIEPGNPGATVANIDGSLGLFRLGVISFLGIFLLDIVISWALYVVFRGTNRDIALGAAWFRLIYTGLLGVAIVSLFEVLHIVTGPAALGIAGEQVNAATMLALDSFESMWLVGLSAFGIHLVLIGVLIVNSGLVSKALGYILMAAGVAYVADTVAQGILPDYGKVESLFQAVVAVPSMIGEGWLGLWLLLTKRLQS